MTTHDQISIQDLRAEVVKNNLTRKQIRQLPILDIRGYKWENVDAGEDWALKDIKSRRDIAIREADDCNRYELSARVCIRLQRIVIECSVFVC